MRFSVPLRKEHLSGWRNIRLLQFTRRGLRNYVKIIIIIKGTL